MCLLFDRYDLLNIIPVVQPGIWNGGGRLFLLCPPSLSPIIRSPFPPLPLEVGPLNPARGLGDAVSSPSRVFGAF